MPGSSYKFVITDAAGATIRTADNIAAFPGSASPTTTLETVEVRLSLTSGTPVTTADVLAATSIFVNPYKGNRIALYDGINWNLRAQSGVTAIPVPATTSTMYDVFCYDSVTIPTYETLAWTNDTTRATALTTQDGILVKSGDATRRYIGSFRTTTVSGQTEDSGAKRYLWNYYNRVQRSVFRFEATASWTYNTATIRQANGSAANQVDVVVGFAEVMLDLSLYAALSNTNTGVAAAVGIGVGSTTTMAAGTSSFFTSAIANGVGSVHSRMNIQLPVGRSFYCWNEISAATGVTTWLGTSAVFANDGSTHGLQGSIWG